MTHTFDNGMTVDASESIITDFGGPAFPVPSYVNVAGETHDVEFQGMTLRDYFAAKAMQGELACQSVHGGLWTDAEKLATYAYLMADAMLKARNN